MFARSSITTWPASVAALAMITPSPTRQSWAMCAWAMIKQSSPILRQHAAAGGAAMNRHKLANLVSLTNARFGRLTLILQILRGQSNRDERKDVSLVTDRRSAIDHTMDSSLHAVCQVQPHRR